MIEINTSSDLNPNNELKLDVAIIGAGASGLYSGYRILTGKNQQGNSLNLSVNIFELSDRIGGRLESIQMPGMNFAGELGGMRYMTSQQIITSLIQDVFAKKYGLKSIPFPMGDSAHHLFYLRKQRFLANSWELSKSKNEKFKTRYFLDEKYEGKSAYQIFNQIISQVLESDGYSLEAIQKSTNPRKKWNEVKQNLKYNFSGPYDGKMVYELGFWNLIKDQSSQECYEFLSTAGGYYSNTINWNASEAFPYLVSDFTDSSVKYHTIKGGYDQVLTCLAKEFSENGGKIWINNKMTDFQKNNNDNGYKYVLTIQNQESNANWSVYTNNIILAMPRRSLELLNQQNFFFLQNKIKNNISSVIIEPSFKILLGFEYPWWIENLNAHAGESITDLPMRQCYYFGVDEKNQHAMLLASYNDMRTVQFWRTLESDDPFEPKSTKLVSSKAHMNYKYDQATKTMVSEVVNQLSELHGFQIPEPYTSAFKDWSEDPFGGGYHAWKANAKVWEIMPQMRHPITDESIHVLGDTYSDQQGWVEGAFCVSEHLMRDQFDLSCPPWLDSEYYLGW